MSKIIWTVRVSTYWRAQVCSIQGDLLRVQKVSSPWHCHLVFSYTFNHVEFSGFDRWGKDAYRATDTRRQWQDAHGRWPRKGGLLQSHWLGHADQCLRNAYKSRSSSARTDFLSVLACPFFNKKFNSKSKGASSPPSFYLKTNPQNPAFLPVWLHQRI